MATTTPPRARQTRESVVIRFAGDSGDGMQVTGSRFTVEAALVGNDLTTFPDFPAEIRAPAGTTYGVSAFQIHFGGVDVTTPGDEVDVLVAMNPAALKVDLKDLRRGGTIVVDTGAFTERNLAKAGFPANPIEDGSLAPYQVLTIDITRVTPEAVKALGLSTREAHRCRNMWALGLMLWMYGRDRQVTTDWLRRKFADRPELAQANVAALNAGHAFGETAEMSEHLVGYTVARAPVEPGRYRAVSGTEAIAWGLIAGMRAAGLQKMIFAGYPITPASLLLHTLANLKAHGVITFQAEDEIAAIGAVIGAAYAGALGVTSSSGPGMALKTEMLGLAIATELPLVVVNSQRAGPSTGMPTKAEQSDLFQAVHGRNADAPLAVIAPATASGAHRHEVHDSRDPAFGRLPGSCRRAVAPPRPVGAPPVPCPLPHRPRGLPPVPPRSGDPGACVGRARYIRPRAPHRRAREGLRYGAHFLRSGESRANDPHPRGEDRRDRERHPTATRGAGRRPRRRRRGGLGLDVRRDSTSGPRSAGRRARRLAHPPSLSEPVPVEPGTPAQAVRPCARAGDEYRAARAALARVLPRARGGAEQSGRETVQSGGDRASDRGQRVRPSL